MALNEIVRRSIEKGIRENIEGYKGWNIDHIRGKQIWHYENETDFWYGHLIGSLIALSYTAFKSATTNIPSEEEQQEIWELVQVHSTEIREIVKSWK